MVRGRGDRDNHLIQIKQLSDSLYESEAADSTKETGKNVIAFFASVTVGLGFSPHK